MLCEREKPHRHILRAEEHRHHRCEEPRFRLRRQAPQVPSRHRSRLRALAPRQPEGEGDRGAPRLPDGEGRAGRCRSGHRHRSRACGAGRSRELCREGRQGRQHPERRLRRDGCRRGEGAGRDGSAGEGIWHPHHRSQLRGRGERAGTFLHLRGGSRRHPARRHLGRGPERRLRQHPHGLGAVAGHRALQDGDDRQSRRRRRDRHARVPERGPRHEGHRHVSGGRQGRPALRRGGPQGEPRETGPGLQERRDRGRQESHFEPHRDSLRSRCDLRGCLPPDGHHPGPRPPRALRHGPGLRDLPAAEGAKSPRRNRFGLPGRHGGRPARPVRHAAARWPRSGRAPPTG